ncbi:hypothetical protein DFR70_119110 [Nocardia tenerifensis]|uniref:Uncharacterized protein n=1 Tax=Nocardia tenerifensis TaxID=228006 RepID=A0A318JNS4_9NOCA|nr:hypothetical protein [Nocardia tenerifensis]PXX56558.1 hypothetical protein DFR70_119110 [Nocardia tenerifensis]
MDWRDSASPQARDDLDTLFEASIGAAADTLGEYGTFAPFMLVVDVSGARTLRALGEPGAATTEDALRARLELPGDGAELRARATVFAVDAVAPVRGDAIKVALEHCEGQSIDIVVPYRLSDDTLDIDMNRANATAAGRRLWRARAGAAE